MYAKLQPQTLFNLDNISEKHSTLSKTVNQFQTEISISHHIFKFLQNLMQAKIQISTLFSKDYQRPPQLKKVPSIEKFYHYHQPAKLSSNSSLSERLSIKLYPEFSQNQFYLISQASFDLEPQTFSSQIPLTFEHISILFDPKEQELILISLSILIKYLDYNGQQQFTRQTSFYLVLVASILGNKIYHDAQIPNIISQYSQNLGADGSKLKFLQTKMLKGIHYNLQIDRNLLGRLKFYALG